MEWIENHLVSSEECGTVTKTLKSISSNVKYYETLQ